MYFVKLIREKLDFSVQQLFLILKFDKIDWLNKQGHTHTCTGIFSVTTLWKLGLFVLGFLKYTVVLYILVIHSENVNITFGREVESSVGCKRGYLLSSKVQVWTYLGNNVGLV